MDGTYNDRAGSPLDWEPRFHGYRFDAETGLYQVRYRYLQPELGRWISSDPIEELAGLNRYVFVKNDPIQRVDPDGRIDFPGPKFEVKPCSQAQWMRANNLCKKDNGWWSVVEICVMVKLSANFLCFKASVWIMVYTCSDTSPDPFPQEPPIG